MERIKGIGLSTMGGRDFNRLSQTLSEITETGADYAELSLYKAEVIVNGRVDWGQVKSLHKICQSYPLRYTVHGPLCTNLMDENYLELHKNVLKAMIDICHTLGSEILVVHGGRMIDGTGQKLRLQEVERNALTSLGDYAVEKGVNLSVETLFASSAEEDTSDPLELTQTLSILNHPAVYATLDFSHAALMTFYRGIDYVSSLKSLAPWVNHLHVHDSFGRHPHTLKTYTIAESLAYGIGDLHLPLGKGTLPWETILPQLPIRPDTVMIIELSSRWWSERKSCLEKALYYKSLFPLLEK